MKYLGMKFENVEGSIWVAEARIQSDAGVSYFAILHNGYYDTLAEGPLYITTMSFLAECAKEKGRQWKQFYDEFGVSEIFLESEKDDIKNKMLKDFAKQSKEPEEGIGVV